MKLPISSILSFLTALLLVACGGGQGSNAISSADGRAVDLRYADYLTITDYPDGYSVATIRNPWDSSKALHTYVLLPDSVPMPAYLPEGTLVRTPLTRSVVYSSVHNSLITELGAIDAISGVCDPQYIHQADLAKRIDQGLVANCGSSMAPNLEQIIALQPQAILLSPYENNNGYGAVEQISIPIVECADYMETSPLGRAEWVKFYGMLYGQEARADSMFANTEAEYSRLKAVAANVTAKPKVMMDLIWSNVWHQPAANSTMGIFLSDAGAQGIAQDIEKSGSIGFTPEEVLYRAQEADYWLMRYAQAVPMTLKQLAKDNEIYTRFPAFKNGQVYGCDTQQVDFYEETPYHPERLLSCMIALLHPELADSVPNAPVYFTKIQ